ncbi:PIG-L family deacetylase [Vibrio nigripulchritudo]|uniref:PIG-L family deacetylase n=1 Tax=Vibrio nigripulchritudo TaxID=28173 RepID=UPI0003B1A646|nr:PIG-L family deacetylase [Vibrio nigripulchritudo]CCN70291.1 GlcNAc-PI de-N-acetylase family [Vibrio nigripulchritudo SFn118]
MNLYLFAHQDDEFFCLPKIKEDIDNGINVKLLYLTDGGELNISKSVRNDESTGVLTSLGVDVESIIFLGSYLKVSDGYLHRSMNLVLNEIKRTINISKVESVIFPCYEGGHQDHDSISWLVSKLRFKPSALKLQFSLYNGENRIGSFFKVMSCIASQQKSEHAMYYHLSDLSFILTYKSQLKSFLGLGPFILLKIIFRRKIALVEFSEEYLKNRPHAGLLLYEKRFSLSYTEFLQYMTTLEGDL